MKSAEQDLELFGNQWLVEDIGGRGVVDNAQTTVEFAADGTLSGSTGVNRFTGKATLEGDCIEFWSTGHDASSRPACVDGSGTPVSGGHEFGSKLQRDKPRHHSVPRQQWSGRAASVTEISLSGCGEYSSCILGSTGGIPNRGPLIRVTRKRMPATILLQIRTAGLPRWKQSRGIPNPTST